MTESGLLFLTWLISQKKNELPSSIKTNISKFILSLVNWLYTTSGYYDKTVPGSKFNFSYTALNSNFYSFINHLRSSVSNCYETQMYFHDGFIRSFYEKYKNDYHKHYNIQNPVLLNDTKFLPRMISIYKHIHNKRVCIVSSFSELIQQQYESGNVYKLGLTYPFPTILSLSTIQFPYCFLNNGPHQNYFETLENVFQNIKQCSDYFDIVLLGCGAYGHMLTHKIHTDLNKDAIYVGGTITNLFGILSSRELKYNTDFTINDFWITSIPDKYKPPNYKDIEDGCYW